MPDLLVDPPHRPPDTGTMTAAISVRAPRASVERVPSTPALIATVLFPLWTVLSFSTDVSPWAPAVVTAVYLAIDYALGLDRKDLPLRLCLLFAYGLLGIAVHTFIAHSGQGVLFGDEAAYHAEASALANGVPAEALRLDTGWSQLLAYFYRPLGHSMVLGRYLNALFGALLVGLLVQLASGLETRAGSARKLYWLAGASPALLIWAVSGIRDLGIAVGAALLAAALMRPERRVVRGVAGLALAAYLALPVLWIMLGLIVAVLALRAIERGQLEAVAVIAIFSALVLLRWGLDVAQSINDQYFSPADLAYVDAGLKAPTTLLGTLQSSFAFPLVAPLLVIFEPIWFATLRDVSLLLAVHAIAGLGWWLLLPSMALGSVKCWTDRRTRPLLLWAAGALILSATGLQTVVQDPVRLRVMGLGAFFLIAWRAVDLMPERTALWTRRWVVIQIALAGSFWLALVGFPVITRLVPSFGG